VADNVKRVVTADVYAWMTPVEGVPGRWQHNTAARGESIEVSSDEAKRGEGLGFLEDPDSVRAAAEEAVSAEQEAVEAAEAARQAEVEAVEARSAVEAAGGDDVIQAVRPPRAAAKAAWVDYAVSQGADRGEAEAMSKEDLVGTYGA
jgi:hypothetical protein